MEFKLKPKIAATAATPQVAATPAPPTVDRVKVEINIIRDYVGKGKVAQAAVRLRRLPDEQRNQVLLLLSAMPQTWKAFKPALLAAKIPMIDVAGLPYDPFRPVANLNKDLKQALDFQRRPLGEKMIAAVATAPLADETKKELLSLLSPATLALAGGVFLAAQYTPAGWVLDAGVVLVSAAVFGKTSWDIGTHLGRFVTMSQLAGNDAQLKQAGAEFAQVVALVGVSALVGLLGKLALKKGSVPKKPPTIKELAVTGWAGFEASPAERAAFRATFSEEVWNAKVKRIKKDLRGYPEIDTTPMEELVALREYTIGSYEYINEALRSPNPAEVLPYEAQIKCIVSAMNRFPSYLGEVFRGTDMTDWQLLKYRPGNIITEDAFTSTSRGNPFSGNTMFSITSLTGKRIETISRVPHEREVLFPPGTKFLVKRFIDGEYGDVLIELEEVKK